MEQCKDCKYAKGKGAVEGAVLCKRYPPSPGPAMAYYWPSMEETDWCGEFEHSLDTYRLFTVLIKE